MSLKSKNPTKYVYQLIMVNSPFRLNSNECQNELESLLPFIDVNYQENNVSLLELTLNKRLYHFAKQLLEIGANANTKCQNGNPLLFKCATNGDYASSVLLISNGANIHYLNEEGLDFLAIAKEHEQLEYIDSINEYFNEKEDSSEQVDTLTW